MKKTKSAGGVVVNQNGEILVVNQNNDSWSLPKGHIEKGEDSVSAARREIEEESGIKDLVLIKQLPSYKRFRIGKDGKGEDQGEMKEIDMFLFKTNQLELAPTDPGNPFAEWITKDKVSEVLTHQKDKEFFNDIMLDIK